MDDYFHSQQEKLDEVMPWIGMYIAAASAVCVLAMAADVFSGIRCKKLWFPCKYFSLNAASLTLLAIAMKLSVDLTTNMHASGDVFAKVNSLPFVSMAMGNFISSLGSMNDKTILMNSIALGLLVTTIVVNMWIHYIQIKTDTSSKELAIFIWIPPALMLTLLAIFVSLAITLASSKRCLESKYQEMYEVALREEELLKQQSRNDSKSNKLMIKKMKKYLMMAETGSLQFVVTRSVVSTAASAICLYAAISLTKISIEFFIERQKVSIGFGESIYGDSTRLIWAVQFIGVIVGTIAPAMRWFIAVSFNKPIASFITFKQVFKIEAHWIQALVYWRDSFSTSQVGHYHKCRKYLHDAKWLALTFCIGLQISIVVVSKLLLLISTLLVTPIFLFFNGIEKLWIVKCESSDNIEVVDLSRYVLLLEGEEMLPKWVLENITSEADRLIQTGRKKQPQNLILLLNKSSNFNTIQVPNLHYQKPTDCWTLPIVTLTSIAIAVALPCIEDQKSIQLVRGVEEGMLLANLIDKNLDKNSRLLNVRNVANVAWAGVVVYRKWQGIDLKRASSKYKNSKEILQHLSTIAERTILEFKQEAGDFLMDNPLNWPAKVIAANSMFRITQIILLSCQGKDMQTDEELFEQLSVMIANIVAACLTNLVSVIMRMCRHNAIEKREKSVRKAFLLLVEQNKFLKSSNNTIDQYMMTTK